jgi:Fe2+ transport system protein FeoA
MVTTVRTPRLRPLDSGGQAHSALRNGLIPLHRAHAGQLLKIHFVPPGTACAHFLRVGMHQGEYVHCLERLPGGTVVLKKNRQQLAVGHKLARKILVVVVDTGKE